ncbi:sigma-54-dependent transcriptional regulator [Desulfatitalea alkaliphila]|uniref:Sigma-54 dependent transcriptional regulator n=1 Tax=Desulfatitalea alkaliphila TaxID=2929485 RepID=A0AA41UPX6_9BACT|nr:sigma-54 dependent transcriptional regulator [Desulfatitalea alkaliphila]MCJ8500878.1 sigma-54 dependent transcriptional regulator [Desulfatitalea alkaliphila]
MSSRIILVDDDHDYLELLAGKLRSLGYTRLRLEDSPLAAAAAFDAGESFDVALIDMTMPEMDGMALLERIKNTSPGTECIMVTAINEARTAVDCLRKGAYDYLVKPVAKDVLALTLPRALERKRLLDILDIEKRQAHPALSNPAPFEPILTQNAAMQRILKEAELHASSNVPILITGESGTGKELLARAIHNASSRSQHPFTPINMASISPQLFEAEFFGHTRGAFTGATAPRAGFLEHTDRGTLFLDEIGDLPLELQGKLLRVLQEGEFSRVGSNERIQVDLRFIAATNEDLDRMISRKAFRKDLFYRIRGGWLHLPPLRERQEDIELLTNVFLSKYAEYPRGAQHIAEAARRRLLAYHWPGNVRELKSVIQSAVNLAGGATLDVIHLPEHMRHLPQQSHAPAVQPAPAEIRPLAEVEKAHILAAYERCKRNKSKTAKVLDIGLNTLRRKLASYGVA